MEDITESKIPVKKLLLTTALLLLITLTVAFRSTTVERIFAPLDSVAKEYLETTLTKTAITYASARVVHATISIAKGSTVNPPFASVAVGEVLTPVADLLQKLSDLLLLAIASLGAQRILLEISQANAMLLFVPIGSLLVIASLWLDLKWARDWGIKLLAVGLIFRLMIPVMATGAYVISSSFLASEYEVSSQVLFVEESNALEATENKAWIDRAKEWVSSAEKRFYELKSRAENLTRSIITLFSLFVFEIVIFPLASLWIFHRIFVRVV